MSNKWTSEQQKAIDTRGKNLLISAAAGSGKTAVLVERIVKLVVEERINIEDMLIVTFTNAAAGEMKQRIQKRLQDIRREHLISGSTDRETADFLTRQIQHVPGASISTVHAFCIQLIRNHFSLADIDPSFKLVNEAYGAILQDEAIDAAFEQKYDAQDDAFSDLVSGYGEAKGDNALRELVKKIDRFVQAEPYPEKWLSEQKEFYQKMAACENIESVLECMGSYPIGQLLTDWIREQIASAQENLERAWEMTQGQGYSFESKLRAEYDRVLNLRQHMEKGLSDLIKNLTPVTFERFSKSKKNDPISEEDWKILKGFRDDAKKIYNKLTEKPIINNKTFLEDMRYLSRMVEALVDLVLSYREIYTKLKRENMLLDFNDLEHLALKILENEDVRKSLQDKYRYIFYDEYQDTNLVQETIVNAIRREDNLFFVGDVKQSIYRFRLADPTIFNKKYARYEKEEGSEKIDLSKNFRSREEILRFCNLIFKEVMSIHYGEVDYKNPSHQLHFGDKEQQEEKKPSGTSEKQQEDPLGSMEASCGQAKAGDVFIELAIIEENKKENRLMPDEKASSSFEELKSFPLEESSEDMLPDNKNRAEDEREEDLDPDAIELEAIYVAKKIRELCAQGKMEYKDIAVLFRSVRGKASIFEKTLAQYGIPSYVDYSSSHYDKLEIKCLMDYLKIVDNRKQDEALLGVMSSVFGNFDNEELIKIRSRYPNGNFYLAAEDYAQYMEDDLAEKLRVFYKTLNENVRREKMTALSDFIWHIAESSGFNTYIGGLDDSLQRLHNIKSLIEKAKEYDRSEAAGLFGFLRHMDSMLKTKGDGSENTILETENVVKIMSIHKSKGLEFHTVFVCDLGKKINEQDLNADVILHNEFGIGLRYKNADQGVKSDNAIRIALRNKKQREGISEEIRILYVALTRAKERLYLVGHVKDFSAFAKKLSENGSEKNIAGAKTYLHWIAHVLIRDSDGGVLRDISPVEIAGTFEKKELPLYKISLIEGASLPSENIVQQKILLREELSKVEILPQTLEKLKRYNDFAYPYEKNTRTRSKTSVTELTKEYKNRELQEQNFSAIKRPDFAKSKKFSSTEVGTIIHFFMENIPIRKYTIEEIEQEIRRMTSCELLTEDEAEAIPRQAVANFFTSELGQRMIASDRVYRERSFLMKSEDELIEGVIDCYFEEDDEFVILDYKTDVNRNPEKHKEQLKYYRQAVEAMEKKKVKGAYIYWIAHNEFSQIL